MPANYVFLGLFFCFVLFCFSILICAKKKKIACQKRRSRDASMLFCLVYFFASFPYIAFGIIRAIHTRKNKTRLTWTRL